jgi:hypothetical protein
MLWRRYLPTLVRISAVQNQRRSAAVDVKEWEMGDGGGRPREPGRGDEMKSTCVNELATHVRFALVTSLLPADIYLPWCNSQTFLSN